MDALFTIWASKSLYDFFIIARSRAQPFHRVYCQMSTIIK